VISDTHGLLREEALRALRGVDLIIHAGDVGKREILTALEGLAPVVAIRGNVDIDPWTLELPVTAVAEADSALIYVIHNLQEMDIKPAAAGFHIVVSGHTHKPQGEERDGVLYLNPGSAGPRRFQLPVTVARLDLGTIPWKTDWVELV
jgi:uncharacterized protein